MFKVMIGFSKAMLTVLPIPWLIWVGTLLFVNAVVPLFFLGQREAQAVLAATMLAAIIQMVIFKAKGYVRLLGIAHLPWVPVVLWLASRMSAIGTDTLFGQWILAVIVIDGLSLVIDAVDVGRYITGERTPATTLEDA